MRVLVLMALLAIGAPARAGPPGDALPPEDMDAARTAWRYFERNYQPTTGFVNSVESYPSTSSWDLGSSLLATIAAERLGLVDRESFDQRVTTMLRTLETQPLFRGALPNKAYDAASGSMTDYANQPAPAGIGWSALDVGRLASSLHVLARLHPQHQAAVLRVLERWHYCDLVDGGELHGAIVQPSGDVAIVQEGRLGYEQYAAHALERLGFDLTLARRYDRFSTDETILGVRVRRDTRDQQKFHAVDVLATDPWVLDALEFGVDDSTGSLLGALFAVQKRRWEETGIVTAASEDHVDRAPWFVYGSIWANGQPWRVVTPTGEDAAPLRAVSTKAAFALAALFPDDAYAKVLRAEISGASDPQRGWFAGIYDTGEVNRALTANTNGVVLETLLWKAIGPLNGAPGEIAVRPSTASSCRTSAIVAERSPGPGAGGGLGAAPGGEVRALSSSSRRSTPWLRLDGSFFGGYRGADRGTLGGVATLWIKGYSFVRIGGESTPMSPYGSSRLLWGVGYDDWHDRTFFAHVDNWGPIRPQDGFAIRQAEATAGYKLPRMCLGKSLCAAPIASVVAPFAGGPYLHARMTLTLARVWFVMGGVGWTVPGVFEGPLGTPRWRIVYGLGRTDWRPGGLFVTYYDWGPDSHQGNGILAVGVNWGF